MGFCASETCSPFPFSQSIMMDRSWSGTVKDITVMVAIWPLSPQSQAWFQQRITGYPQALPVDVHEGDPDGLTCSHDTLLHFTAAKRSVFNLPVCSFPNGRPNSYPTGNSQESKGALASTGRVASSPTHRAKQLHLSFASWPGSCRATVVQKTLLVQCS